MYEQTIPLLRLVMNYQNLLLWLVPLIAVEVLLVPAPLRSVSVGLVCSVAALKLRLLVNANEDVDSVAPSLNG